MTKMYKLPLKSLLFLFSISLLFAHPGRKLPFGIKKFMFEEHQQDRFLKERLEYEFNLMKDPRTGKIPEGIRRQEWELAQRLPVKNQNNITGRFNTYIEAGPANRGGRTRALKYDKRYNGTSNKVILAGCVSGGILRSSDAGVNWTRVTPENEMHNITCIAQDPRAGFEDTWYVGTGEFYGNSTSGDGTASVYFGYGMLKSTDNGISWAPLAATRPGQQFVFDTEWDFVYAIKINPANGDVYVACDNNLKKSTNGGTSFTTVFGSAPIDPLFGMMDVEIKNDGSKIFLGVTSVLNSNGGLFESATGNAGSWTKIAGGQTGGPFYVSGWKDSSIYGRIILKLAPSNQNLLFCYYQNGTSIYNGWPGPEVDLFKCDITNPAYVWTNLSANMPDFPTDDLEFSDPISAQFAYDMCINIKPDDPNVILIGGTNLYRSTNGFTSTAATSWIGGYDNQLYDIGMGVFEYSYNIYPNSHPDIHAVEFNPSNYNEIVCGNDGGIQKTANILGSPITWSMINNYQSLQYTMVAIDPGEGRMSFIGGSQDNGTTFRDGNTDILGPRPPYRPGINDHEDFFGGDGGSCGLSVYQGGNQYAYVSAQYGVFYRIDLSQYYNAGANYGYTDISPDFATYSPFSSFQTLFHLDQSNTELLYPVYLNKLFRTTSASTVTPTTWTLLTGMSDACAGTTIRSVAVTKGPYTSSSVLYAATQGGKIFRLNDPKNTAASTAPQDISIPSVLGATVIYMAVNPQNDNELMAVLSNYNVESIWITRNAKSATPTWVNREGNLSLPSIRSCAIVSTKVGIDTVYEYYVGTTIGLYSALSIYDSSSTLTWAREGNNVLNMPVVTSLDLRNNDNTLLVGTHGNGMYYTQIPNPIPLPVTWLDFTATRQDKNVELKWSTAQELNAQKFVVQRRYQDETDFRDIGEVTARGNANTPQHYSFNDLNITQTGTVYYRLKQVDRDGRISYSRTVNVKFNDRTSQFVQLLYPNPVKDILIIKTGHAAGIQSIQFSLIDQSGKIIIKKKIPYSDQSIGLDHIPAGLYYVRMSDQTGNNNFVQKIIKQ